MQEPDATATTMATSLRSGFPDWVLLDTRARIGHCNNATTAEAKTSALCPIKVSFEIVDPPGLSRCIVHCPDLNTDSRSPPLVIGADGAFLLIRVYFPVRDGKRRMFPDVFVYRADPRAPSLHLVPRPYPIRLHFKTAVGVLAASGDDVVNQYCSIVIPERVHGRCEMSYSLEIFCTKTMSWSTKVTRLDTDLPWYGYSGELLHHEPTKVFSIGGGSLAWVDLRHGIMMCNVLDEEPELRLIQMPQLLPSNRRFYRVGFDGARPPLDPIRDVSFRDGRFSCIEMEHPYEKTDDSDDDTTEPLDFRWRATVFKTSISSRQWEKCHTVASTELSRSDPRFLDLFPEIWVRMRVRKKRRTVLSKDVISSRPILDMYSDDTVYMTSKLLNFHGLNGWLFAVDTKARKLEKVVPFSEERTSLGNTKLQCAFSKYLNKEGRNSSAQDLDNPEHVQQTQQGSSQQQSQQSDEGLCNVSSPSQGMLVSMKKQVQQASKARCSKDMYNLIAGRTTQKAQQQQLIQQGSPPDYKITIPALLPGPRCLTDASIATDQTTAPHRAAGLGVLIINTQTNQTQTIIIQGSIDNVSSVIMAEAAAMALAARIARALGLQQANYLTDNQVLVNFFNSNSLSTPPDRRIKPLTQDFIHSLEANQIKVYKIARETNITAHSLANQAHRLLSQPPSSQPVFSFTNLAHVYQCPVKNALDSVNMSPFRLHTVRCA